MGESEVVKLENESLRTLARDLQEAGPANSNEAAKAHRLAGLANAERMDAVHGTKHATALRSAFRDLGLEV